jgi:hypothetical protein
MCTFNNCLLEDYLFGGKKEWIEHELDYHRARSIWFCGMCRRSFESRGDFGLHLQSSQPELSSDQLLLLQENCKRYLQEPLSEQPCALCGELFDSIGELVSHIGNHLETYALASFLDDELDDSEGLAGDERVEEYIEGLDELQESDDGTLMAGPQTQAAAGSISASLHLDVSPMPDTINAPDIGDLEDSFRRPDSNLWNEKVTNFLDKQPIQDSTVHSNKRSRDDNFVGRNIDLLSIREHLSSPGRICTVSGRGGIGKTALAIEYLHKFESDYSYVFWVEAESPGLCAEKYNMIASVLDLIAKPFADADSRTYLVRGRLTTSEKRWLLVFDNAASWKDIARYIPRSLPWTQGSVLITTRSGPLLQMPSWHPAYFHQHAVSLDVWPLEHGRQFLLASIQSKLNSEALENHEEYDLAADVVNVVGRLPLAINMIVGYVKVSRCTLADFLEMWEEKEHNMKKRRRDVGVDEGDIDATIDSLWTIGIREVRVNSRRLLDVLSFLNPETIPKKLLVGDHKEDYLEFLNASETLR